MVSRRVAVPLGLGILALFAVVAAATRGHSGGTGRTGSASARDVSYLVSTYLVLAAATAAFVVFLIVTRKAPLPQQKPRRDLRSLLFFLFAIALVFGLLQLRHVKPRHEGTKAQPSGFHSPTPSQLERRRRKQSGPLHFTWIPLVVLGSLAGAGAVAYVVRRKRRPGIRKPLAVAAELERIVDDALDDLRRERDPRRAVIAAYARMESLLAAHGLARHPAEAPFEYLPRVLAELRAGSRSAFELTALFERAKFSHHAIEPELKEEAIAALETVRDKLREAA
jgi:hypothetical protein